MGQVISDLKAELFSLFSFKQACLVLFIFYVQKNFFWDVVSKTEGWVEIIFCCNQQYVTTKVF